MHSVVKIERTVDGTPALWEKGGGTTNAGSAILIADRDGRRKRALIVRTWGHVSNGCHALIPIECGDILIAASRRGSDYSIAILKIGDIDVAAETACVRTLATFKDGVWDHPLVAQSFRTAITVAMDKVNYYHCREAMYCRTDTSNPLSTISDEAKT